MLPTDYSSFRPAPRRGFTLIELLATIAIIGLLAALAFPASRRIMDSSQSAKCAGNLRSIGQLVNLYMIDNQRLFPKPDQWSYDGWIDSLKAYNGKFSDALFHCPSDSIARDFPGALRSYAVNNFLTDSNGKVLLSQNGSKLIMLSERATSLSVIGQDGANDLWWSADITPLHSQNTVANTLYTDGHVEALKVDLATQYWGSPFWVQNFNQTP